MVSIEKWIPKAEVPKQAPNLKVIFLGATSSGKTSLVEKLDLISKKERDQIGVKIPRTTVGVDVKFKGIKLQQESYFLTICDFPGDEKHHLNTTTNFFRSALGAFIVFDINKRKTFEEVDQWASHAKEKCGEDVILCLIANKSDLRSKDQGLRQVGKLEIEEKYQEIGAAFYAETCAIDKDKDVTERTLWALLRMIVSRHSDQSLLMHCPGSKLSSKENISKRRKRDEQSGSCLRFSGCQGPEEEY